MQTRKAREASPAPRAKPRDRKRFATDISDGPQRSVNLVDLSGPQHSLNMVDFSTSPNLDKETVSTQKQTAALNREQLDEVKRAVIVAMSSRTETSHPQNEMTQDASAEYPGFSANRSSGVFMDTNTRAILQLEVGDSREVGRHSPKMERLLIERGLLYLVHQSPLIVWEIISDASRNIISLLKTEPFKHLHHSLDMWHKAKKLAVTMADITKKSACRQLLPWIRPIINHFWWSCSTCRGSVDTLLKWWMAILHHINNKHIWPGGRCRHPEGVTEIENKKWLERDSEAFKQLRKMVTNREWCGTIHFYTNCKQTWAIEKFFSHTLLHYCPKANSYSYDSYRIRNILAVMDHSNHLGRMPQVGDDDDSYAQAQVSRRTKQWVAYERKTPKDFKYIPDLMAACLHKTYGVPEKAFSKSRKSLELDKVAKNLSGDKNPRSRLLLAEMKSRKNTGTDASQ